MSDDTFDQTPGATSDDDLLAVGALVDGVATHEERARVESSPELTALAESWRGHQARLADRSAITAGAGASDAAVAAAMAAFDEIHAPSAAPIAASAGATVIGIGRVQRRHRLLMGAAAAVSVLFVGAAVIGNGLGSNDDSNAGVADVATKAAPDDVFAARSEDVTLFGDESVGDAADDVGITESAGSAGSAGDSAESAVVPAESSTESMAPAAEDGTESTGAPPSAEPAPDPAARITGPAEVVVSLATPEQLLDFARSRSVQLPLPGFEFPCVPAGVEALGLAEYQGLQVVVTRDPATGEVAAIELVSCDSVTSIRP